MTAREQKLVMVLLAIFGLIGAGFVGKVVLIDPLSKVNEEKEGLEGELVRTQQELDDWNTMSKRLESLNPRIAQWRKLSLPEGDRVAERDRKTEAFKTHVTRMREEYQQYLTKLTAAAGVVGAKISSGEVDFRAVNSGKPVPYFLLGFTVKGLADQAAVRKLVHDLEKAPLLHQIRHFSFEAQKTTAKLSVTLTIEVLLVNGADMAKSRSGIFPQFSGKGTDVAPVLLARTDKEYADSDKKPIFTATAARDDVPRQEERVDTTPKGESAEDVLSYVRLTLITDSPYYNCRIARINNLGTRANATSGESVLLVDAVLPTDSAYQQEKKEREKLLKDKTKLAKPAADEPPIPRPRAAPGDEEVAVRTELPLLEEPARKWTIRDRFKLTTLEFQVIKIEPLRMIIQADDKFYSVAVGDTLWEAMAEPLGPDELKKLNLVADKDEVLKKVKLTKLASSKDRNGEFEATFVNPENKDEKIVLATEAAAEELSATDSWSVRDRFKTEAVKIKVVKLDKDGVIFAANKKYHRIKAEQTLFEALAKPLAEDEIKTLKLPGL